MSQVTIERELLERERQEFEKLFPKPMSCVWTGYGYCPEEYGAWSANDYAKKWSGWIARAALQAAPAQPVNQVLVDALKNVMSWIDNWSPSFTEDDEWPADRDAARSALAQAQAQPAQGLTIDEVQELIELCEKAGHDDVDFEAECRTCTARVKLLAIQKGQQS